MTGFLGQHHKRCHHCTGRIQPGDYSEWELVDGALVYFHEYCHDDWKEAQLAQKEVIQKSTLTPPTPA